MHQNPNHQTTWTKNQVPSIENTNYKAPIIQRRKQAPKKRGPTTM